MFPENDEKEVQPSAVEPAEPDQNNKLTTKLPALPEDVPLEELAAIGLPSLEPQTPVKGVKPEPLTQDNEL